MIALVADDPAKLTAGDHRRTLTAGGIERDYLMHIPPGYEGTNRAPVVLAFHGGLSNARQMVHFCGLNDKADEAGFIVIYPNGTGLTEGAFTWNGGNCCGHAQRQNVDDVAFIRAVLDDLAGEAHIDPHRVYATGMSNGGLMAYRVAAELSDRIAAIAPIGGPMGMETCRPARPVSVIHFHGTDDKFAPFEGGKGERSVSQIHFFSVSHSIDNWVRANECPPQPAVTPLPAKIHDGTQVTRSVYGPGKEGAEVVLYRIEGAGHTWPGRKPSLLFLGKSTQNISANDLMWEFFEKHARRE
jgi:polyhydroxybutyrate depolymerase